MQGLMMQGTGLFGPAKQTKAKGFNDKDHVLENVRRMRNIQKKCQDKEAEATKPVKAMWKSDRYADVPSKVRQDLGNSSSSRPSSATFLRAHSRSGPSIKVDSRPCTPDASSITTDRMSVPLALSANEVRMERHDINFVKMNGRNAKHCKKERPPSARAIDELLRRNESAMAEYSKGEVPAYLRQRQKQWKKDEKERVANTPDPSMPPGHRSLPEHERLETLALLQQKEKDLVKELAALPIATDTVRVHNKRRETESKLLEVEEAIRIFSRPKVFVKVDS